MTSPIVSKAIVQASNSICNLYAADNDSMKFNPEGKYKKEKSGDYSAKMQRLRAKNYVIQQIK